MKSTKSNYPKSRFARRGPDQVGRILTTVWSPESGHLRWSPQRGDYIDNDLALHEEEILRKQQQIFRDSLQPSEAREDLKPSSSVSQKVGKRPCVHPSIKHYLETLKDRLNDTDFQD